MQEMKEISGQPPEENYSRREEKSRTHKRCKKEDQTEKKHENLWLSCLDTRDQHVPHEYR